MEGKILFSIICKCNPKILHRFNETTPTCREHCTEKDGSTLVLEVLIFIPAMSQAAAKPFRACWSPDSEEASKTKSSAKKKRSSLNVPNVICNLLFYNATTTERLHGRVR